MRYSISLSVRRLLEDPGHEQPEGAVVSRYGRVERDLVHVWGRPEQRGEVVEGPVDCVVKVALQPLPYQFLKELRAALSRSIS